MKYFFAAAFAACLLYACSGRNNTIDPDVSLPAETGMATQKSEDIATDSTGTLQSGNPAQMPDWTRKIVKTANLKLELKSYASFSQQLPAIIKQYHAYTASEQESRTAYEVSNQIVIKVPVDQFENMVAALSRADGKLLEKNISSEDVSAEVVDTKSRMEAKKQVRLRYMELLQKASKMEDILLVQQQINEIQEEIETAQGRIRYLSQMAAYSTIHLQILQVLDGKGGGNESPGFFTNLWTAFKEGANWMLDLMIGLVHVWPLIVLTLLGIVLFRRRKTNTAAKPVS